VGREFLKHGRVMAFLCMLPALGGSVRALSHSTGPAGSNVQAVHAIGYTGQGVKIGFLSVDNVYADHPAFLEKDDAGTPIPGTSRVIIVNPPGVNVVLSSHDTQMAGILISSGAPAEPYQIGAAPGATLYDARISGGIQQAIDALLAQGCNVIVSGFTYFSEPVKNDGKSLTTRMYDYYAFSDVIFATAAGNFNASDYPYHAPPSRPGDAYNGITTGGLIKPIADIYDKIGSRSLAGPTYDNRRKPEVAAPSPGQRVPTTGSAASWTTTSNPNDGLTSWAVPHTAGVAAVLLEYAQMDGQRDANRSEVIKAVMVNSTFPNIDDKSGNWTDPANQTWHTDRGYGRLDALRAFETLCAPKIIPGQTTNAPKGWAYQTLGPGQTHTFTLTAHKHQRLVMTLTWHRRVVWKDRARWGGPLDGVIHEDELSVSLANLDLQLFDPDGCALIAQPPTLDNLEKADIRLTKTGDYQITVSNLPTPTSESAHYALAFEVLEPLAGDWNNDYRVDMADFSIMSGCWLVGSEQDAFESLSSQWLKTDPRYWGP